MTGPEHYREAERLLASANPQTIPGYGEPLQLLEPDALTRAQVHATLALAAATALIDEKPRSGSFDQWREWQEATGAQYPPAGDPS